MQNLLGKLGLGEQATSMVVWIGLSILLLVVVVALAIWLVRTLRPTLNMSGGAARGGRPQRLAITDAFTLDREGRKLVIIRRDNVEHLLLIGGPNDMLVESAIVRGERSIRDRTGRTAPEGDALTAEVALVNDGPRTEAPVVSPQAPMAAPQVTMAAPAPRPAPSSTPVAKLAPPAGARLDDDFERALVAMQAAQRQQATAQAAQQQRPAVPPAAPAPAPQQPSPPPARPTFPPPAPAPTPATPQAAAPERAPRTEPVSEMARRLNEVLQKPLSGSLRPPFNKPIPPVPATMNSAPRPPAPAAPTAPPAPAMPELPPEPQKAQEPGPAKPSASAAATPAPTSSAPPKPQGTDLEMDLLEEEMARLLGRPGQPKPPGAS